MSENRFRHESLEDNQSIAKYLEAIIKGIRHGQLSVSSEGSQLNLHPQGLIRLVVEAKQKEGEVKLALKMRWKEEEPQDQTGGGPLTIQGGQD